MAPQHSFEGNARPARGAAKLFVQEDALDDSTMCTRCGGCDLFAYTCKHCDNIYCERCVKCDVHRCEAYVAAEKAAEASRTRFANASSNQPYVACSERGCATRSAVKMLCFYCKKNFCSAHHLEGDHVCDVLQQVKQAKQPTPAAPAVARPVGSEPYVMTLPRDVAQDVSQRVVVKVVLPPVELLPVPGAGVLRDIVRGSSAGAPMFTLVTSKRWGVGKLCDALSKELGQQPSVSSHVRFTLHPHPHPTALPTMQSLASLFEKEQLFPGQLCVFLQHALFTSIKTQCLSGGAQQAAVAVQPRCGDTVRGEGREWANFVTAVQVAA